jgi:uncharacterized membrane protein YccC
VITAFIVFAGTQSRGEILSKGSERIVGTLAGVVIGLLVATAASGYPGIMLALVFVCIFLGFYLFQVAYAFMIFWVTVLIALLYGLLGYTETPLLVLRFEETAIGAAIGIMVAMFLLPTRTRDRFNAACSDFLRSLADLVERFARPPAETRQTDLTVAARDLDRQLQSLRAMARPLTERLAGALAPTAARRWLRVLTACSYYARSLARLGPRDREAANPAVIAEIEDAAERIRGNIDTILRVADRAAGRPITPSKDVPDQAEAAVQRRLGTAAADEPEALRMLLRIDQAIALLARDMRGASGEQESAAAE